MKCVSIVNLIGFAILCKTTLIILTAQYLSTHSWQDISFRLPLHSYQVINLLLVNLGTGLGSDASGSSIPHVVTISDDDKRSEAA